jgi:hypothetical protein
VSDDDEETHKLIAELVAVVKDPNVDLETLHKMLSVLVAGVKDPEVAAAALALTFVEHHNERDHTPLRALGEIAICIAAGFEPANDGHAHALAAAFCHATSLELRKGVS